MRPSMMIPDLSNFLKNTLIANKTCPSGSPDTRVNPKLHKNKILQIIHTRMAARNVLLANQFGGYVAKLIGFNPSRESQDKDHKV